MQLSMPEDALRDHHRVVDQHADGKQHAHHRQDVEREPHEIHGGERDQQRGWHCEAHDQRGREVPQEEQQHEEAEHGADQARLAQLAQRAADAVSLVADDQHLDALELRSFAGLVDGFQHAIRDVDHVGLGRLVHVDANGRAAIHAAAHRQFRRDQLDLGDVAEPHARGKQQVAHVVDAVEFADRAHREARVVLRDLARAHREIALLEQGAELAHVDAVGGEPVRIDEDAHLARLHALQLDARDALDALDRPLQVLLQHLVLVGQVLVGRDADHGHRLVAGAEGEHQQPVGAHRQLRPDRIELGAHIERGGVHVAIPVEQHREGRLVGLGARPDFLDARQRRERLLDRAHHQFLHLLRGRPRVRDDDLHAGERDVRHGLEPQQLARDQADGEQRERRHDGGHGAGEGDLRVQHGGRPLSRRLRRRRLPGPRPAVAWRRTACGPARSTPPGSRAASGTS